MAAVGAAAVAAAEAEAAVVSQGVVVDAAEAAEALWLAVRAVVSAAAILANHII